MKIVPFVLVLACVHRVASGPLLKRQGDATPSASEDEMPATSTLDASPTQTPSQIDTASSSETATPSPPASPSPGTSPSPSPVPEEDDCPPCDDEPLFTSESSSGKACYCLGGGQKGRNNGDREPWAWGGPSCEYGSDGAGLPATDDDKPQVCSGNGAIPASRECLNSCNFMLSTVNSANPCSANVVNAANACARCSGANMFVQTGKDATGTYMNGARVAAKLIDGLQGWCARPNRCYDLKGGRKISGQGGCPVLAVNDPISPAPSIVTTSTRSFTDINGRPTFAIEMLTIEDPNFSANTELAGSRPTGGAGGTGNALVSQQVSLPSCFIVGIFFVPLLLI